MTNTLQHVSYDVLDAVKLKCIEAAKKTLSFSTLGKSLSASLGASANIFAIPTKLFKDQENIFVSLIPEGLGTADDAKPEDLSSQDLKLFWYNIGLKTVSVLTNDAASSGLQTVLLGLYLPTSTPKEVFTEETLSGLLDGIVEGCKQVGCCYFSGETPELRTKITPRKLDVAGSIFAMMPPGLEPVSGQDLKAGDRIVLVASSGPHENGYTTLRSIADKLPQGYYTDIGDGTTYWKACNAPSVLYTPLVQEILKAGIKPSSLENITGHGWQKIMRSKKNLRYVIENPLPVLPIFKFVEKQLGLTPQQTAEIFNYGSGFAIFCNTKDDAAKVCELAKSLNMNANIAGHVEHGQGTREVVCDKYEINLKGEGFVLGR